MKMSEAERIIRRKLMTEYESKRIRTSEKRIRDLRFLDVHLRGYNEAHNTNLTIAGLSEELKNLEVLAQTEEDKKLTQDCNPENYYQTVWSSVKNLRAAQKQTDLPANQSTEKHQHVHAFLDTMDFIRKMSGSWNLEPHQPKPDCTMNYAKYLGLSPHLHQRESCILPKLWGSVPVLLFWIALGITAIVLLLAWRLL